MFLGPWRRKDRRSAGGRAGLDIFLPNIVRYTNFDPSLSRCVNDVRIKNGDAALLLFGWGSARWLGWYGASTIFQSNFFVILEMPLCAIFGALLFPVEALYLHVSVDLHESYLSLVGRARATEVHVRAFSKLIDERTHEQRLPLKVFGLRLH